MLGCQHALGLQSKQRTQLFMSSNPWLQDSSDGFGQPFHVHPWLKELQTAKADTGVCVCVCSW